MKKVLATWPVRKNEFRNMYCYLLLTERDAEKRKKETQNKKRVAQPVNVTLSLNGFLLRERDEREYSLY